MSKSEVDRLISEVSPKVKHALNAYVACPCVALLDELLSYKEKREFEWQLARIVAQTSGEETEIRAVIRKWIIHYIESCANDVPIGKFVNSKNETIFVEEWNYLEESDQTKYSWSKIFRIYWMWFEFELADEVTPRAPFRHAITNQIWSRFDFETFRFNLRGNFARMVAKYHPAYFSSLLVDFGDTITNSDVLAIAEESEVLDGWYVDFAERILTDCTGQDHRLRHINRVDEIGRLAAFSQLRDDAHFPMVMRFALMPEYSCTSLAVGLLLEHEAGRAFDLIREGAIRKMHVPWKITAEYERLIDLAMKDLGGAGGRLLHAILVEKTFQFGFGKDIIGRFLKLVDVEDVVIARGLILDHVATLSGAPLLKYWSFIASLDEGMFIDKWREWANGKSKPFRDLAAAWMQKHRPEETAGGLEGMIASENVEQRLVGVSLLAAAGSPESLQQLAEMHAKEPTKRVRVEIARVLAKSGIEVAAELEKKIEAVEGIAEFEGRLRKHVKSIRAPRSTWLDLGALPPLYSKEGDAFSELAIPWLMQQQARSPGSMAPEVAPVHPFFNRQRNGAFANALLDQWFSSGMKAADRWALDVAGLVGDDSIIRRLIDPIPDWCEKNHGSRGEWVAHAIALLGTDKALLTLDQLAHRFRNHRKYVGEAATAAMRTAAEMMGISDDELAERIVPDFGFDTDGCRLFKTRKGRLKVRMGMDFKLAWSSPEGSETAASPPLKLGKADDLAVKEFVKSLKEVVTRMTHRLETSMISGRRWTVADWQGRFERHPVFRVFGMRQIWGVYDGSGKLLRTFRLYENGLTADGMGELEEFSEGAASVGLVHCLAMDDESRKAWGAHFARFKVKPVFKQIDRPVHALDELHRNRKQIQMTDEVTVTAGELRRELRGKGWSLGSTSDGGWIDCVYRKFPACGIEVYLPVNGLHAASVKDDEVNVRAGYFARTVQGKKAYRDQMDVAEPIPFGDVPPIVFSEVMADLKFLSES
jgi:hypothetical protein